MSTQELWDIVAEIEINDCTEGNCIDGKGVYTWTFNHKYEGQFKNGVPHGNGTFYLSNGDKYIGEFLNAYMHGVGTYYFPDDSKYVGEFEFDEFNGTGTYYYANGNKYIGGFKDGVYNGEGVVYFSKNGESRDVYHDNGELISDSGIKHVSNNHYYINSINDYPNDVEIKIIFPDSWEIKSSIVNKDIIQKAIAPTEPLTDKQLDSYDKLLEQYPELEFSTDGLSTNEVKSKTIELLSDLSEEEQANYFELLEKLTKPQRAEIQIHVFDKGFDDYTYIFDEKMFKDIIEIDDYKFISGERKIINNMECSYYEYDSNNYNIRFIDYYFDTKDYLILFQGLIWHNEISKNYYKNLIDESTKSIIINQ